MKPVTSSNIEAVGHDGKDLWIKFRNGGLYAYEGVPASLHEALMAAKSPGGHFYQYIRNGGYKHRKIDAHEAMS